MIMRVAVGTALHEWDGSFSNDFPLVGHCCNPERVEVGDIPDGQNTAASSSSCTSHCLTFPFPQIHGTGDEPSGVLDQLRSIFINLDRRSYFSGFFCQDVNGVVRLASGLPPLRDVLPQRLPISVLFGTRFLRSQAHSHSPPAEHIGTVATQPHNVVTDCSDEQT